MRSKPILCSSVLATFLGSALIAHAAPAPSAPSAPPAPTVATQGAPKVPPTASKTARVERARELIDEVNAARDALLRGEHGAALDLVRDAVDLEHDLARNVALGYAVLGSSRGQFEEIDQAPVAKTRAPVVSHVDAVRDIVLLDLVKVRENLDRAEHALVQGKPARADRALARIADDIRLEESIVPEPLAAARANLRLAWQELEDGHLAQAEVELGQAGHDLSLAKAKPATPSPAPIAHPAKR